jgi:hypothetical protein
VDLQVGNLQIPCDPISTEPVNLFFLHDLADLYAQLFLLYNASFRFEAPLEGITLR